MEYDGRKEILDDTPLEVPSGLSRPESITDTIKRMVRDHVSAAADRQGFETFEESNDFELPDDEFAEPVSPHEYRAMDVEVPTEEDRDVVKRAARGKESEARGSDSGEDGKKEDGELEGLESKEEKGE